MSKVLRVQRGGIKLITEPGAEIRLDTGNSDGQVTITGNLTVQGETTYLNVADLQVEDRVIELNKSETGPGITGGQDSKFSGLFVHRGGGKTFINEKNEIDERGDAYFVFDEEPYSLNNKIQPSFVFRDDTLDRKLIPITTYRVQSYGIGDFKDITLFVGSEGLVKVEAPGPIGTPQYHERLLALSQTSTTSAQEAADATLPNFRFLKQYVQASAGEAVIQKFTRFTLDNPPLNTFSGAQARDISIANDQFSGVLFTVGSGPFPRTQPTVGIARIGKFGTDNGLLVGVGTLADNNLKVVIDSSNSAVIKTDNCDLTIAPDTRNIILKNVTKVQNLSLFYADPLPETGYNTVFSREQQGSGGTGLFFTNNTTTGELCSAANALVYGLIF